MICISKPEVSQSEQEAVLEVLRSGNLAQGAKVWEAERALAPVSGTKHAVALSSGTAALHTALKVAGVKPGDEVITTPFSFIATGNCILMQGATPVFCDIERDTFNLDPMKLKDKITDKTTAVIAVDLYGQLADYDAISAICSKNNLVLIEDAAQSIGAEKDGKPSGSFGDVACFSFYATKNITSGEGGALVTDNQEWAAHARLFRQHGRKDLKGYDYSDLGYNYRMTDIQGALLSEQLKRLRGVTESRRENAKRLSDSLSDVEGITVPAQKYGHHAYHQYTIIVEDDFPLSRDALADYLREKGVGTGVYYPLPLHLTSHFRSFGFKEGDFEVSEEVAQKVLSLPVHPGLTKEDCHMIAQSLKEVGNHG